MHHLIDQWWIQRVLEAKSGGWLMEFWKKRYNTLAVIFKTVIKGFGKKHWMLRLLYDKTLLNNTHNSVFVKLHVMEFWKWAFHRLC